MIFPRDLGPVTLEAYAPIKRPHPSAGVPGGGGADAAVHRRYRRREKGSLKADSTFRTVRRKVGVFVSRDA